MKKHILLVLLLSCISLKAQHKVGEKVSELLSLNAGFKPVSVLAPNPNAETAEIERVVDGATLATLTLSKINEIVANRYDYLELQIPYQNESISVLLYGVNPFSEGFHVDTDRTQNIAYQKGVYYRGIIKGDANSVSSFNFFNGEFNGIISSPTLGNVVVGKLDKRGNQTDYIVYSDAKMKVLNPFDCHTKEAAITPKKGETNKNANSNRCVSFYFEMDYDAYLNNGSDKATTMNWMTSVFNNVQTLYANDGVSTALKSVFIWTSLDPYEGGTQSTDYLLKFADTRTVFDGDVGQLVGMDSGSLGGVAFLDTLCTDGNYGYTDVDLSYSSVPVYSWTVELITHELGHSLGSPHTHACLWNGNNTAIDGCAPTYNVQYAEGDCPIGPVPSSDVKGSIMSYCHLLSGVGISFANGFGPQPAALILNNVNSRTCLSADCVSACPNMVADITVSDLTSGSMAVTWEDLGSATTWQIAVVPFSSGIVWNTVKTKSYTVSELDPNTYYKIYIRPYCENIDSIIREKIFATSNDFCSGMPFTDTGGISGNYSNMESWTRTVTPTIQGVKAKVAFSGFDLEPDYDYLYIYDGANVFADNLTPGGLTGKTLPGSYTSSASDGSLTFKFSSDEATTAPGWEAVITCQSSLGVKGNDFLDFSYYPNPTTGKVTVSSKDMINEVVVYNIEGRLLYNQKPNQLSANVDISQFASGTYFFKLRFNDGEANFKVLKM